MAKKKRKNQTNLKLEHKFCKGCEVKFYRRSTETPVQWSLRHYHNRTCQLRFAAKRAGKKNPNLTSAEIWDACTKYITGAHDRLCDRVTIYSSEDMSQGELERLVPSEQKNI
jgi:hypothetical protein